MFAQIKEKCLHFVCSVHKLDESKSLAPLASTSASRREGQAGMASEALQWLGRGVSEMLLGSWR